MFSWFVKNYFLCVDDLFRKEIYLIVIDINWDIKWLWVNIENREIDL